MKKRLVHALLLTGIVAISSSVIVAAQETTPAPGSAPNSPPPARPGGGLVILDFKPAMDDLMTMLVQPRHIKLYFAGQAKNWKLAEFQLNELRASLARIGRTIPNYRNINVDNAVASIFADKLKVVDAAIKSQESAAFAVSYKDMTEACNGCHAAMEHEFLVIKVPDALNYPDQEFRP
jgi:hypothetical protein